MKTIEVLLYGMDNLIQAQEFTDEEVDYMRMRIKKLSKQFGISEEEVEKMLSRKKESDETALDDYEYNYKLLKKKLSKKADPREEDEAYATAAGTTSGNVKGWITRKHGKNIAQKKKSSGLYSKPLHSWAKSKADDLQLDDSFVKKYPKNWIEMSYRIAYTMAKKRFK